MWANGIYKRIITIQPEYVTDLLSHSTNTIFIGQTSKSVYPNEWKIWTRDMHATKAIDAIVKLFNNA